MKMNYKTENRTPRDRLSGELFFREYGNNNAKCSCSRPSNYSQADQMPVSDPCGGGTCIDSLPLAMVYSPMQQWRELFDPETALNHGTLFKELVFPWYPTGCKGRECR